MVQPTSTEESLKGYIFIMSIYRRLNPRLLVQVGVGLNLLHWANMSNISLISSLKLKMEA